MKTWLARLRSTFSPRKARRLRRQPLQLEHLEDRLTPAVITLTSNGDTIALDTFATLREAITSINNQSDINNDITVNRVGTYASLAGGTPDVINFNIPGGGVQTIAVTGTPEPTIIKPLTINGYSQTGASANTLNNADNAVILIQLDGASAGAGANGLTLGAGSAGSTIRGLDVTNFKGNGIVVQSNGNSILGNFIGVDATGATRQPNGTFPNSGDGILIQNASNNQVGSPNPGDRNIASGNALVGIHVVGTLILPATGNIIQGNFVGVAADGVSGVGLRTDIAPAPGTKEGNNLFGIEISGGNLNTVGGTVAGARNVVGFNGAGIEVDNGGQQNVIQGNFSGVGADGLTPVGNLLHGIVLRSSNGFGPPLGPAQANEPGVSFNQIGGTAAGAGNTVEYNGTAGISVFGNPVSASGQPNVGNSILGNTVYLNGRNFEGASSAPTALLGIDLTNGFTFPRDDGPTPNDSQGHGAANDPNNFQNAPVVTSFFEDGAGNTGIAGNLKADPNKQYRIEFFASDPDPLHLPAEGQQYLGFTNVTTNGTGNVSFTASFNVPVDADSVDTATATDSTGNTSEFSAGLALSTTAFSAGLTEFSGGISTGANPASIVQAADGNVWFTEFGTNALGRITPAGLVTQFSLAGLGAATGPLDLVSNTADGFIYFTEFNTGRIGKINPSAGSDAAILASETQSAVVPSGAGAGVHGITVGPDGNLWFTETAASRVGTINPALTTITEFITGITTGAAPVGIVAGPDGALWFTESNNAGKGAIGRITTGGTVTEFLLTGAGNDPEGITVGPDGALWFTEAGSSKIGRITTAGDITTFALPTGSNPQGIASGPFGLLYFAESARNVIGSITTDGVIAELGTGLIASGSLPTDVVAAGRDLWFTEVGNGGNTIGRFAGLSDQERLVQSLYVDALGRAGAADVELDGWADQLPEGATTLTPEVTAGIEGSPEARDHLVKGWYQTYLGRQAQNGEELAWVTLLNQGQTEEQVLSQILGEPGGHEFFDRAQTLIGGADANANFVQALYQLLLNRTGDATLEVAGWVDALQSNTLTRQQVAFDFLTSQEYRTYAADSFYLRLLHRTADPTEIAGWVNSKLDLFTFRTAIEASAEHAGLVLESDYFSGPPADLVTGKPPTFAGVTTINDLYVFRSPGNAANTVFAMTFQPFPGVLTPDTADPDLTYEIHIDVTGDGQADLVFQVTYGAPDANGVQSVTLRALPSANFPPNGILAQGETGQNIATTVAGGLFRSGIQDEPGFFDAGAFNNKITAAGQFPRPVGQAKNFYGPNGNTFAIVLEIPSNKITFPANNPNKVMGVWATINKNGAQLSRMGRPLIEDALLPPQPRNNLSHGDRLSAFAASDPANDRLNDPAGFRDDMISVLTNPQGLFKRSAADAGFLADALLPDLVMFQIGNPGGYGTLVGGAGSPGIFGTGPFAGGQVLGNGRQFRDDVVDIDFNLLTNGAIPSDNVGDDNGLRVTDGSIDPISNTQRAIAFPYIGAANLPLYRPGTKSNP
ncbi:MAG TPA: DUF4331 family protein [Gemmataceae bacterium]|nr:DUF4331 family protein [Gemmataceae bacterium]